MSKAHSCGIKEIKKQTDAKNCWFDDGEGLFHCLMPDGTEWTSPTGSTQDKWTKVVQAPFKDNPALVSVGLGEEDIIGHPNHYCEGRKYEPKDVIRDWNLNFNLGNAVKYIARNGRKDGNSSLQDLKKAKQYLEFEIDFLEKETK